MSITTKLTSIVTILASIEQVNTPLKKVQFDEDWIHLTSHLAITFAGSLDLRRQNNFFVFLNDRAHFRGWVMFEQ